MRAVYKSDAHKGCFRAEHLGVYLIKHFPAQIIITVAGCSGKAGVGYLVVLKCGHHLPGVEHCDAVYALKLRSYLLFCLTSKLVYFGSYIVYVHFKAP